MKAATRLLAQINARNFFKSSFLTPGTLDTLHNGANIYNTVTVAVMIRMRQTWEGWLTFHLFYDMGILT